MKKLFSLISIFTISIVISLFSGITAHAEPVVLGEAVYSDVVAYINHYPIPSYSFNGKTLIIAEDLTDYGFDVYWNEYKNTVQITRNKNKNDILPMLTFVPPAEYIGTPHLTITTTDVRVHTGNYFYECYGGLDGYTFINIEELSCIDNTSVVWVPETRAIKVWVEDGLEMRTSPWEMKILKPNQNYYTTCEFYGGDVWHHWQWIDNDDILFLSVANINETDGLYCECTSGRIEILDVIDADGHSRKKPYSSYVYYGDKSATGLVPYFYDFTDYLLSTTIWIENDDLLPHTASEYGGLVKFKYSCYCDGYSSFTDTIKVDCLPH